MPEYQQHLSLVRESMDEKDFAKAWNAGRQIPEDQLHLWATADAESAAAEKAPRAARQRARRGSRYAERRGAPGAQLSRSGS